ncbi:hypothetical protein O0L34_g17062 [Tuta absoluta]|nr:hypothetical protein O0L34_g17062 [Tuta absoluta]
MEGAKSSRGRKRCKGCYDYNVGIFGSKTAKNKTTKVNTYCMQCKGYFCLSCFNGIHHGVVGDKEQKRIDKVYAIAGQSKTKSKDQEVNTLDEFVSVKANQSQDNELSGY